MKKIFLFVILFLNTIALSAANVEELWQNASNKYSAGSYSEALELYQSLEKEAGVSASLYYNIGNCYFKDNQLAKAILYYNKAQKLDPSSEEIRHNLAVANAQTTTKIKTIPTFFLYKWLSSIVNIMSSNSWAQLSIIMFALLLAMVVTFLLSKRSFRRKLTFAIGTIALVFMLISVIASAYQHGVETSRDNGIIMSNAVAVKSSPDNSGKDIFVLSEGVKVSIKEQLGKWSKVTVASGDTGWVETSNIEII